MLVFSGGIVAAFVAESPAAKKVAVHRIASTGLLILWISGAFLATKLGVSHAELWITLGFFFSFVTQGALVSSIKTTKPGPKVVAIVFLVLSLVDMVYKPTWEQLLK
ncbi:MAG TPA: hypothetical protein VM901_12865 [Bdellovibrionota bacterium]|nr:hypothetical protein [Bdellovibrionota bacterium]